MNLKNPLKWMLRQSLGTKRGNMVIALLEGPLGMVLDLALEGKPSAAVAKIDAVVDSVRDVIGVAP